MKVNCIFVSVWDGGTEVRTKAIYDDEWYLIDSVESVDVSGLEILENEYLEFEDGTTIPVCKECHEGIIKTYMEESIADPHSLIEVERCSNCGEYSWE